jgi:hypothetical protein
MAVTINGNDGNPLTQRDVDGSASNFIYIQGQFKLTGNYPAGGDVIDWTTLGFLPGSTQCLQASAWSINGNLVNQFVPVGSGSTALNAWKLKISAASSFGTEFTAGAYSAALLADTVAFVAVFRKFL